MRTKQIQTPEQKSRYRAARAKKFRDGFVPPQMDEIMPQLVTSVLSDSKSMKPSEVGAKHNISMDMLRGIKTGKYDRYLKEGRADQHLVRCNGTIMLYDEKGYTPSGKSIKGAIEISDDAEFLKCHECGEWWENLAAHAQHVHGMLARDYKKKHGLKFGTCLLNDKQRLALIQRSVFVKGQGGRANLVKARAARRKKRTGKGNGLQTAEVHNARGQCSAQLAHDLRTLAEKIKRLPTMKEIKQAGISLSILRCRYGGIKNALNTVLGKMPAKPYTRWYSDQELIAILKNFGEVYKRQPFMSDCRRGFLPAQGTYAKRFGSWRKALRLAGFRPVTIGYKGIWAARRVKKQAQRLNAPPVGITAEGKRA